MCHLRHGLRIFLFHRKVMFRSQYIQVFVCIFNHPMTYQIYNIMMSISTWDRVHFWEPQLISHRTWKIDRYKQRQYFSEIIWAIWRAGTKLQALFNLATCSNHSITCYVKFLVFHFYERANKGEFKMVNIIY